MPIAHLDTLCARLDRIGSSYTLQAEGILVHQDLYLSNTDIQGLPDNLTVQGALFLDQTAITELPRGLVVLDDLSMDNTKITSLPGNLWIGGSLFLCNTPIVLPDNLLVRRDLFLMGNDIHALPRGLHVQGLLSLLDTKIRRLPPDMRVGGCLVPPEELLDITAFMAAQAKTREWIFSGDESAHERMETRFRLQDFPDLLTTVLRIPEDEQMRITPLNDGGFGVTFHSMTANRF